MNTQPDISIIFNCHKELIDKLEDKRRKCIRELILDYNVNIFSQLKELNRRLDLLYEDINSLG